MAAVALLGVQACVAATGDGTAASATALPQGTYVATQASVVVTGRTCAIGAPLVPAFTLQVASGASLPSAIVAVLRDDAADALPIVAQAEAGEFAIVDPTEPPTSTEYQLGRLAVIASTGALWVAVDYRRIDFDCRVSGTLVFTSVDDEPLAAQTRSLSRAFEFAAQRDALRAAGNSSAALEPAEQALATFRSTLGPGHRLALNAETNIASLYWDLDDFKQAREWNERAIARLEVTLGADHFHVWRARQNLALVLWDVGELAAAEQLLRSAGERYRTLLHEDDAHRLGTLVNLATLVGERGRVVEAERILVDVLIRYERTLGPEHPRTMLTLNNLAAIVSTSGRYDDALLQYSTAVERYVRALGPRHPATLRARHNRVYMLARTGQLPQAIEQQREVWMLRRDALGVRHSETLQSLNNLAGFLADAGKIDEAMPLQRDVVEGYEATHGPVHYDTLRAHAVLGALEARSGSTAAGLERMERAYGQARAALGSGDVSTLQIGMRLGASQRAAGASRRARQTYRQVVEGVEAWRESGAQSATARRTLFAPYVSSYKALSALELQLGDVPAAFAQAERSKARVLVETLALRRGEARDVLPAADLAALARLDREIADAESAIARAPRDPSVRLPLEQRRTSLGDEAAALRRDLRARYPKYAALSEARILSVAEGAKELPAQAVFVSYLRDGDRVIAFTLDRRGRLQGRDLGEVPGLDDAVIAYRALLLAPRGEAPRVWRLPSGRYRIALEAEAGAVRVLNAAAIGADLTKRLILPLAELVRAKRWIVSPDAALALLPFEALPLEGRPVVATREVSYAPSLTVHALTARRGREYDRIADRAPLYAMGAARYAQSASATSSRPENVQLASLADATARDPEGVRRAYDAIGARWPDLPGSAVEIRQVADHFRTRGVVTVRGDSEATEAQLMADDRGGMLARHRYVLLSAHGYLSTEAPSLSAVVLGQEDVTPEADGYVTAAEWSAYTLRSDLIVISACETGAGKVIEGEGVAGLPYALFVAGNRNVLLTLWPVADRSTASFVSRFFGHLRDGMSQSVALARTKREFATAGSYTAPLHWAPFVLWGAD
jgi:tetratricopeptide (TPR) repeat protein